MTDLEENSKRPQSFGNRREAGVMRRGEDRGVCMDGAGVGPLRTS